MGENKNNVVIAIGRQYGSGGFKLGTRIAEELGIPCYDKELVELAAEKSNMSNEALKHVDERATGSLLYSIVTGTYTSYGLGGPLYYDLPINDKLFLAQSEVIREVAEKGPCVIIGRCADYVLKNSGFNCISVFVYAGIEYRVKNVMAKTGLVYSKAKESIQKTEKHRRAYYDYYTNRQWGNMTNYDLCINIEEAGEDLTVEMIKAYAKQRMQKGQCE